MRVLIFHGYLLSGTGSNVYNAELAAAFVRGGHRTRTTSMRADGRRGQARPLHSPDDAP